MTPLDTEEPPVLNHRVELAYSFSKGWYARCTSCTKRCGPTERREVVAQWADSHQAWASMPR